MKIITLWEPWATLLALGEKKIETRGWSSTYRGPVAIHSAKGGLTKSELKDICTRAEFATALRGLPLPLGGRHVPLFAPGHILAVGKLVDCFQFKYGHATFVNAGQHRDLDTGQERAFGNYGPGRYGLVFEDMVKLKTPIPFKSRQGKLLDLDEDTVVRVLADLAGRLGE